MENNNNMADDDESEWEKERSLIPYTTQDIVNQMSRRLFYQELMHNNVISEKYSSASKVLLPEEYSEFIREWCEVHDLNIIEGIAAMEHFKSLFGKEYSKAELWIIMDSALVQSKNAHLYQ